MKGKKGKFSGAKERRHLKIRGDGFQRERRDLFSFHINITRKKSLTQRIKPSNKKCLTSFGELTPETTVKTQNNAEFALLDRVSLPSMR